MKNYKAKDIRIIMKNTKIISKLKKLNICLFILNFAFIRFNFLSPKDLKIFYYKNNILVNFVYSCLGLYYLIFIIVRTYEFYKKRKSIKYSTNI